jgi:ADP-ribosylglycohydrolase
MSAGKRERTLQSLAGLSVGDAFGQRFFTLPPHILSSRHIPEGPWAWTDDTHMALSIVEVLLTHRAINQDELVRLFVLRFGQEPWRGYAGGAQRLLTLYFQGANWRDQAPRLFKGGSYGTGGAMRAAPIGAYFTSDPERAAFEARRSAAVTHAHPEGQAGAMAVAAMAAIVSSPIQPMGVALLREVLSYVPASRTREGIVEATRIDPDELQRAIAVLGTGNQVAAFDTVPYCLWIVAHHAPDYETALWSTVAGLGDRDTTCAIVGGIVALRTTIPAEWLRRREPLPEGFET